MTKDPKHLEILQKAYGLNDEDLQHLLKTAMEGKQPFERLIGRIACHAVNNQDLRWCMKPPHQKLTH